jgi:hypothetical protein
MTINSWPSGTVTRAEPGFARAQPTLRGLPRGAKEGAHGGTMGSPVLGGGERYVRRLEKIEELERMHGEITTS